MESLVSDNNVDKALRLATICEEFSEFKLLRELYYLVEFMYSQESYEEAEKMWDIWTSMLPPSSEKQYKEWCDLYSVVPPLFDNFRSFSRKGFQFFKPYILNYFKPGCGKTNAATEGINNLIRNVNTVGNGYSFKVLRAKCLFMSLKYERVHYRVEPNLITKEYSQYTKKR